MKKTKKEKEGARKILKKKKTNENGINWPDLRELKKKKCHCSSFKYLI
jgi:hypothetical protein